MADNKIKENSFSLFGIIFTLVFLYLLIIQPLLSSFFEKDILVSETVLVKVQNKETGSYDLGLNSKYKYKYYVQVIERDGWIGYIRHIYSNKNL